MCQHLQFAHITEKSYGSTKHNVGVNQSCVAAEQLLLSLVAIVGMWLCSSFLLCRKCSVVGVYAVLIGSLSKAFPTQVSSASSLRQFNNQKQYLLPMSGSLCWFSLCSSYFFPLRKSTLCLWGVWTLLKGPHSIFSLSLFWLIVRTGRGPLPVYCTVCCVMDKSYVCTCVW